MAKVNISLLLPQCAGFIDRSDLYGLKLALNPYKTTDIDKICSDSIPGFPKTNLLLYTFTSRIKRDETPDLKIIQFLLEFGFDPNVSIKDRPILQYAVDANLPAHAEALIRAGASKSIDTTTKFKDVPKDEVPVIDLLDALRYIDLSHHKSDEVTGSGATAPDPD